MSHEFTIINNQDRFVKKTVWKPHWSLLNYFKRCSKTVEVIQCLFDFQRKGKFVVSYRLFPVFESVFV